MATSQKYKYPIETLEEKYEKLFQNGYWVGIVVSLRLYSSLSTPEIAKLIDRKKTSVFNYINGLQEKGYVEVDEKRSTNEFLEKGARARKYYRLTDLSNEILKYIHDKTSSFDIEGEVASRFKMTKKDLDKMLLQKIRKLIDQDTITYAELVMNINNYIQRFVIRKIDTLLQKIKDMDDKDALDELSNGSFSAFSNIGMNYINIEIQTRKQHLEFNTVLGKFFQDLVQLKQKFQDETRRNDISEDDIVNQYVYLFSAPLSRDVFE